MFKAGVWVAVLGWAIVAWVALIAAGIGLYYTPNLIFIGSVGLAIAGIGQVLIDFTRRW